MKNRNSISEIQIQPIKPKEGLVAFASLVLNHDFYLGSIGIMTRPDGSYRLIYPTRVVASRNINVYHPINKLAAKEVESAVIRAFEKVVNQTNGRHNQAGNGI